MGDVIQFKPKKEGVGAGKPTLYVSHLTGKISDGENRPEFGDRLARIRASLEKINRLMAELKKMSVESTNVNNGKNKY